ncbi:hypothetical protein COOONC_04183 [Cooperia oncophora]
MASAIRLAGSHLRELRIHLCQKSPASAGVRAFIESDYVGLKKANPQFPILIRECSGIVPRVFARYISPYLLRFCFHSVLLVNGNSLDLYLK